jgi:cystathionine beta-synthase
MARKLAKEEGLFCGYSAGSCLQGLLQLKAQLKKDDLVVCILHDHGSRYVGKIYNDQWMMERGFLEVKTIRDMVSARGAKKLISVEPTHTVADCVELMKKYDIEQIPIMKEGEPIGAISQQGLFKKVFDDPVLKNATVTQVMEPAFPVAPFDTAAEKLRLYITKENGAVMAKDEAGNYHIITKYDVIAALGN